MRNAREKWHSPLVRASYTTFTLTAPSLETTAEDLVVSVDVRNTGKVDDAEVVQVYISQQAPSINRPIKELKGFNKVFVEAGQMEKALLASRRNMQSVSGTSIVMPGCRKWVDTLFWSGFRATRRHFQLALMCRSYGMVEWSMIQAAKRYATLSIDKYHLISEFHINEDCRAYSQMYTPTVLVQIKIITFPTTGHDPANQPITIENMGNYT